jgi:hypothetical protein
MKIVIVLGTVCGMLVFASLPAGAVQRCARTSSVAECVKCGDRLNISRSVQEPWCREQTQIWIQEQRDGTNRRK